jgi:maltose O-acetyltransferase
MTEKEKMLAGELYNAADKQLADERKTARTILKDLNDTCADQIILRKMIIKKLIPGSGSEFQIEPPFFCDYGTNILTGDNVFLNFNCTILDVTMVTIGCRTLLGPNVQIYTATHPMNFKERAAGLEYAKPVSIGDDVWIGGGVIICPGITIGDRSVIGAGSVVTRSIPSDCFAAGNPCRVLRKLEEERKKS